MFLADAALERAEGGDLFAPVLSVRQDLPDTDDFRAGRSSDHP
jgi:hypothetical protein